MLKINIRSNKKMYFRHFSIVSIPKISFSSYQLAEHIHSFFVYIADYISSKLFSTFKNFYNLIELTRCHYRKFKWKFWLLPLIFQHDELFETQHFLEYWTNSLSLWFWICCKRLYLTVACRAIYNCFTCRLKWKENILYHLKQ